MVELVATTGVDTLTGGSGDDTFVFIDPRSVFSLTGLLQAGDVFDGGGGFDTLTISNGAGRIFNFRLAALQSIEALTSVNGGMFYFNASQFGAGGISNNLQFTGSLGPDVISIELDSPGFFSAAGWTFDFFGASQGDSFGIYGTDGADTLTSWNAPGGLSGLAGNDTLIGGLSGDTLDGGTGADAMSGGAGDDLYIIDNVGDTVSELQFFGTDTLDLRIGVYTLADNVENAFVREEFGVNSVNLTGNALNNVLSGTSGADVLRGLSGNDTLDAAEGGADLLIGGAGADTLISGLDLDTDTFADTRANMHGDSVTNIALNDRFDITDVGPSALAFARVGSALSLGGGASVTLANNPVGRLVRASDGTGGTFLTLAPQSQRANDFNHDGLTDLLWRLPSGDTAVWTMNTNAVTGGYGVPVPGGAWALAAQSDFSGDGRTDLLWRNSGTGDVALWTMSNGTVLAGLGVLSPGLGWSLAGTGDFNADNKADLLWRNTSNGDFAVWMMNSNVISESGGPGGLPASWRLVGIADFDGDGKSDLLLRNNTGNHDLAIWEMNGGSLKAGLGMINPGVAWQVINTGDFNNDGKADIVFRHQGTGDIALWEIDGNTLLAGLGIPNPGPSWSIADVNDYNGDGYSDILWRNATNGDVALWTMQENTILAGLGITNPGGTWVPTTVSFDIV